MTPETKTITLSAPITLGGEEVDKIRLRRPTPGELRGVRLVQLLSMETDTLFTVLPRITTPLLDARTLAGLDLFDFGELAAEVVGFFQQPAPKGAAGTMAGDGPTT